MKLKFDAEFDETIDQFLRFLNTVRYVCPWYFSAHFSSFLEEKMDMLLKSFESTWKNTKPRNRRELMMRFTFLLGRFSSLDSSVSDLLKIYMKMEEKAPKRTEQKRKPGVSDNSDTELMVLQSSTEIQSQKNDANREIIIEKYVTNITNIITECIHKGVSQELNPLKTAITCQLKETNDMVCTVANKVEENKQTLSEITEHTTELYTWNRYQRISPVLYFTFVVAFFALLIEEVMNLFMADWLLLDKIKEFGKLLWSRVVWIFELLPNISSWVLSSYNPKKVMWKFMIVIVPFCCVIYMLPALLRYLLGYEVIGFLMLVVTVFLQYSTQSWRNMVVSISVIILYIMAKRTILKMKHYLFYLYLFSILSISFFLYRLYNNIVLLLSH